MIGMSTSARGGPTEHHHKAELQVLRAVATVELTKGVLSLLAVIGLLLLLHRDYWDVADRILGFLHINEDHRFAQAFLDWADRLNDKKLLSAAGVVGAYASLRFVEGYGLWNARVWAEWIALVSGSLYVPFEVYKLATRPSPFHVILLLLNVAIVFYMVFLRWTAHTDKVKAGHGRPART